jgi:hypothetical protein
VTLTDEPNNVAFVELRFLITSEQGPCTYPALQQATKQQQAQMPSMRSSAFSDPFYPRAWITEGQPDAWVSMIARTESTRMAGAPTLITDSFLFNEMELEVA